MLQLNTHVPGICRKVIHVDEGVSLFSGQNRPDPRDNLPCLQPRDLEPFVVVMRKGGQSAREQTGRGGTAQGEAVYCRNRDCQTQGRMREVRARLYTAGTGTVRHREE